MNRVHGSCHCRNIVVELELSRPPATYAPRACDCDFCRKHGAAYVSDPSGQLAIRVTDPRLLVRYAQGSGTADCLVCAACGVLVGAAYRDDEGGKTYAVVNSRVVDGDIVFGEAVPVSPKTLGVDKKVARWKELWFSRVELS